MKQTARSSWIVWSLCTIGTACMALFLPVEKTVCYWVTLLGMIMGLIMSAIAIIKAMRDPQTQSAVAPLPLQQLVIGALLLQTIVGGILLAVSTHCPWLVSALVECLTLTIDASALTVRKDDEDDTPAGPEAQS